MKRAWLILMAGVGGALLAYAGLYYAGTAGCRGMAQSKSPELAWLKDEFHLGNDEFARISKLHESYVAACAERCRRVDMKNMELKQLLASTNAVTPEIAKALAETAQLQAECQKEMLQHFYEVSQTMAPEQGKRYLAWVQERTLSADTHATMQH
jgi:hypothetical protein